jgi:hypothetical protein
MELRVDGVALVRTEQAPGACLRRPLYHRRMGDDARPLRTGVMDIVDPHLACVISFSDLLVYYDRPIGTYR